MITDTTAIGRTPAPADRADWFFFAHGRTWDGQPIKVLMNRFGWEFERAVAQVTHDAQAYLGVRTLERLEVRTKLGR